MHSPEPRLILPEPPDALKAMSRELVERMRNRERRQGQLSFAEYMDMALYEPGLGYYSAGLQKLGQDGDFITAPELGTVFADCLAGQLAQVATSLNGPWEVLEIGAGSGRLAADLLNALAATGQAPPERYRILERSADLRAEQARTLAERAPAWADRVSWLDQPPRAGWRGVLIANEVIDALAVERFEITPAGPRQLGVTFGEAGPDWSDREAPAWLAERIDALQERLPAPLAEGYRSELCATLPAWLASITENLAAGVALFMDYGYPRAEYYHAARRDGTLVCQTRHRAHFDPFFWPGLQDMSAFVDFTALAEAADQCGLEVAGYAPQNLFLFGCGLESVMTRRMAGLSDAATGDHSRDQQALSHEIKELTLPGAMGEKFQVMALARNLLLDTDEPLRGFSMGDWRDRL